MAIPGGLAFVDLLYAPLCVGVAIALAAVRTVRVRPFAPFAWPGRRAISFRALPILAVLASAWPAMVRPVLNGDSLSYHLPNAAAWVHVHGLWITSTRYWWYPGGSELFAAGVFAVAGPFGLPVCGTIAALLLALRAYDFALEAELRPGMAAALASALASAYAIQQQGASLENDVWLSALLLEMLWCYRFEKDAFVRTALVATLLKPVGFVFAIALTAIARVRMRTAALASLAIVAWCVRDALLSLGATIPMSASSFPKVWTTTIAWHGVEGLTTLVQAAIGDGPAFTLVFAATIATLVASPDRTIRIATAAFLFLFLIEPFGFNAEGPLLAIGSSLRYGLPAFVFGGVGALPLLRRFQAVLGPVLLVIAIVDLGRFQLLFVADASTRSIVVVLLIAALAACIPFVAARRVVCGLVALAFIAYAGRIAAVHPSGYYDDQLALGSERSSLFAWIERTKPPSIVGRLFPIGEVEVVSPTTIARDGIDDSACALARDTHSLLVTAPLLLPRPADLGRIRAQARSCGPVLYEDARSLVAEPR